MSNRKCVKFRHNKRIPVKMYEELVSKLRSECTLPYATLQLMRQAANAIEELSKKYLDSEVDNTNLTGWLAEEHAKHLWVPVTERLPNINDRYLTVSIEPWFGTIVVDTMRWSGVWMYDGRQTEATVTHWMPLPDPPEV